MTHKKAHLSLICQIIITTLLSRHTFAAPGELADKPLFLGNTIDPNILLIIDDSGSMGSEVLLSEGALKDHPENVTADRISLNFSPGRNQAKKALELCYGYNVMAYNPEIKYTPWAGKDVNGIHFQDQSINSARSNAYLGDVNLVDLSSHYYLSWQDINNDGQYQTGECSSREAVNVGLLGRSACATCVFVDQLSTEQQKNYANWFTYYRKREYVAKKAVAALVNNGGARMGMTTLHNNGGPGAEVKALDARVVGRSHKDQLLEKIFKIQSKHGTPLRRVLKQAGDYFSVGVNADKQLFGFVPQESSPIFSAADGGSCQQNFSVLMSDGFWNGKLNGIGNRDGDNNSAFDGGSFADEYSNTLADVAMRYYETDLAPGLENLVPVANSATSKIHQHMATYTVAFGVNGTLRSNPKNIHDAFNWPRPVRNQPSTIDDMRHAAWNGRGEFLSAKDPTELINTMSAAFSSLQAVTASSSAAEYNGKRVSENALVFQSSFNSGDWSGELDAFRLDENGVGQRVWRASDYLNDPNLEVTRRSIYSYNPTLAKGVPFIFPENYQTILDGAPSNSLDAMQVRDLLNDAPYPITATDASAINTNQSYGEHLVAYLSGDLQYDGNTFRDRRQKRLGDIVHSSPEFVGKPDELYPSSIESVSYFDFVAKNESRTPMVYVGANDGMLHGFNAKTGKELLAYIPGVVFSSDPNHGIHRLSRQNYIPAAYVDGSPVARDVFIGGEWRTYLVGGLRTGGKGIYVLDVTNPDLYSNRTVTAAERLAVLEFTHPNLGFTFSKPQIAKMNNKKWAVVFGNGYNNEGDGRAKLFIVYLDGSGYTEIDTGVGSILSQKCSDIGSDCNGLSSPSLVDTNGDFIVDRVYAGDLHGHMWAFDLSSNLSSEWRVAFGTRTSPAPLFTACRAGLSNGSCPIDARQPITTKPIAVAHPSINMFATEPNVMVLFGTGQFVTQSDLKDTSLQSFYGVWDSGTGNGRIERSALVEQQLLSLNQNSQTSLNFRQLTQKPVNYNPGPVSRVMGWYIDLVEPIKQLQGERITIDPVVVDDLVLFTSSIPETEVCSTNGRGFLMAADIKTGGQPSRQTFSNIMLSGLSYALSEDNLRVSGVEIDAIPGGISVFDPSFLAIPDSNGNTVTASIRRNLDSNNSRRSSWSILK